jgi:hypothetical protein
MKSAKLGAAALILGLTLFGVCPAAARGQQPVSNAKIIGTWDVEIMAEGQSYYLTLVLNENQGQLEGKISEQSGMFTDAGLSSITFDGENLSFEFTGPTPPDGMQRLIQTALKLNGDVMEGSVTIPDLGIAAQAKATKRA